MAYTNFRNVDSTQLFIGDAKSKGDFVTAKLLYHEKPFLVEGPLMKARTGISVNNRFNCTQYQIFSPVDDELKGMFDKIYLRSLRLCTVNRAGLRINDLDNNPLKHLLTKSQKTGQWNAFMKLKFTQYDSTIITDMKGNGMTVDQLKGTEFDFYPIFRFSQIFVKDGKPFIHWHLHRIAVVNCYEHITNEEEIYKYFLEQKNNAAAVPTLELP